MTSPFTIWDVKDYLKEELDGQWELLVAKGETEFTLRSKLANGHDVELKVSEFGRDVVSTSLRDCQMCFSIEEWLNRITLVAVSSNLWMSLGEIVARINIRYPVAKADSRAWGHPPPPWVPSEVVVTPASIDELRARFR